MRMVAMHEVSYFFGGAFLINAAPHLLSGAMGRTFQTPFAVPRGQGHSSSSLNVLWGVFNLLVAYLLLVRVGNFELTSPPQAAAAGLGILVLGLFLARHVGRFNGGNSPAPAPVKQS
jgi:hypothetical protein